MTKSRFSNPTKIRNELMTYSDSENPKHRRILRPRLHVIFRRYLGLSFLCAAVFVGGGVVANAEERLEFLPYPYGMHPPPKILDLLEKEYDYEEYKGRHRELVLGVPFDIDLDGKPELVVAFVASGACGSAGCSGLVLQGSNAIGWKVLTGVSTGSDWIIVSKDTVNGYRVLIEPTEIRVWNGVHFFSVCLSTECRETFKQGIDY